MNNAFVRVDYYVYTYSISASAWGVDANKSGDMAVLNMADLTPSEIDFLLSQALNITADDTDYLNLVKLKLVESSVLSRMLKQENITFEDISKIAQELGTVQADIEKAFSQMRDFESPSAVPKDVDEGSEVLRSTIEFR